MCTADDAASSTHTLQKVSAIRTISVLICKGLNWQTYPSLPLRLIHQSHSLRPDPSSQSYRPSTGLSVWDPTLLARSQRGSAYPSFQMHGDRQCTYRAIAQSDAWLLPHEGQLSSLTLDGEEKLVRGWSWGMEEHHTDVVQLHDDICTNRMLDFHTFFWLEKIWAKAITCTRITHRQHRRFPRKWAQK